MIILIGGEKGGTGKTTLATNITAIRSEQGKDVLLIDTDKQGSSSEWIAIRDEEKHEPRIASIQKFGRSLSREIKDLAPRYEDIIIDAGGRDNTELRSSLLVADRLYIPIQPSQYDVLTLERMDNLVYEAQTLNPNLKAFVVINRASTNPNVKEAQEVKTLLSEFENLIFSDVVICDRIAYRKTASDGLSICEQKPLDAKANREIIHLYNHVFAGSLPST